MDQNLLAEYVKVEQEIDGLQAVKIALREKIVKELKSVPDEKVSTDWGTFTVAHKRSWTYSPAVEALAEKLKITKHKEEDKGIAKATVSDYLVFRSSTDSL